MPVPQLKDLAIMFGCSVDRLLGLKEEDKDRPRGQFTEVDHDMPFGTARFVFDFGVRDYPVDEKTASRLEDQLNGRIELTENDGWLEFSCLNNKMVLAKLNSVRSLDLISDDAEEMPVFYHPEVYHALDQGNLEAGPSLVEEIASLKDGLTETEIDHITSSVAIVYADGITRHVLLEAEGCNGIFQLSLEHYKVPRNSFILVHSEGSHVRTLLNLSKAALLEVPLERYLRKIEVDMS